MRRYLTVGNGLGGTRQQDRAVAKLVWNVAKAPSVSSLNPFCKARKSYH